MEILILIKTDLLDICFSLIDCSTFFPGHCVLYGQEQRNVDGRHNVCFPEKKESHMGLEWHESV